MRTNGIATAETWRTAAQAAREARAEPLRLPSGATILAAKPAPLEWIVSGRIPQRLLAAALQKDGLAPSNAATEISREEILELARFAAQLVKASVVKPRIGDGPEEISLDDIPVEDRAFVFEWACRALRETTPGRGETPIPNQEDLSSAPLERFCAK